MLFSVAFCDSFLQEQVNGKGRATVPVGITCLLTLLAALSPFHWQPMVRQEASHLLASFPLALMVHLPPSTPMFEEEREWIRELHEGVFRARAPSQLIWGRLYNSRLYNPPICTEMEAQVQPDLGARARIWGSPEPPREPGWPSASPLFIQQSPIRSAPLPPGLSMGTGGKRVSF